MLRSLPVVPSWVWSAHISSHRALVPRVRGRDDWCRQSDREARVTSSGEGLAVGGSASLSCNLPACVSDGRGRDAGRRHQPSGRSRTTSATCRRRRSERLGARRHPRTRRFVAPSEPTIRRTVTSVDAAEGTSWSGAGWPSRSASGGSPPGRSRPAPHSRWTARRSKAPGPR